MMNTVLPSTPFNSSLPPSSAEHPSMEQLRSLKAIYDAAFITRKEYEERKKQLIDKLTNTTSLNPNDANTLPSSVTAFNENQPGNLVDVNQLMNPFVDVEEHLGDKAPLPFDPIPPLSSATSEGRAGILSKEEKHNLASSISTLAPEHLDKIIQLIDLMAPHLLKFSAQGNEYSFDLNEFDDKMLSMVNEYVQTIQNTRKVKTEDAQGNAAFSVPQSLSQETSLPTTAPPPAALIAPISASPDPLTTLPTYPATEVQAGQPTNTSLKRKADDLQQLPYQLQELTLPDTPNSEAVPKSNKRASRRKVLPDFYTGTPDTSATEEEVVGSTPAPAASRRRGGRNGESKFDIMEDDEDDSSDEESEDEDYRDYAPLDSSMRSRAGKQISRNQPNYASQINNYQPRDPNKKIPVKIVIHEVKKSEECPEDKPWKCDFQSCSKCFSDSSNLLKHIRTHTKEKPYGCPYKDCGKSYAHSASLKEHLNTHTGEKPFVCTFPGCTARFAQNSNLRRHTRIHTNEKPYVCGECGKAFTQSSNLKQHLTIHRRKNDK
jgi:hypothetical protein